MQNAEAEIQKAEEKSVVLRSFVQSLLHFILHSEFCILNSAF